mmetsp:Transcript_33537/g.106365  ORF Transcript_33537/g.106365 Transcript_33537/m.106365 type:complete len:571 (+) Transcript_33537:91-1803(+)
MSPASNLLRTLVLVGLAPPAPHTLLVSAVNNPVSGNRFRRWRAPKNLNRMVNASELTASFNEVLTGLSGGHNSVTDKLEAIEVALQPIFQALPKNSLGRLSHEAASYAAHRYFTQVHGWHFRGLGLDGQVHRVTAAHQTALLQEEAPELVAGLLESRAAGRGFTLSDVAAMAATLHRLIMNDAERMLRFVYTANKLDTRDAVEYGSLSRLFMSLEIVSLKGFDLRRLALRLRTPTFQTLNFAALGENVARTFDYQRRHITNPFVPRRHSFSEMTQIAQGTIEEYGSWQDGACQTMKTHLMRLDPMGSGRVPLGTFYAQPDGVMYNFSESRAYLRHIGALDESVPGLPRVLISNYVVGPANCYSSSTYYKFCCFNECNDVMATIEKHVQAPEAAPESLLPLLGNLSTASVEAPRQIPAALVEKLQAIGGQHEGKVPIHGRLFAQWLHFAFPTECPYPHLAREGADDASLAPTELTVGVEEKRSHMEAASSQGHVAEPTLTQWTDEELLLFQEKKRDGNSTFRRVGGLLVFAVALVALLRSLMEQCSSGMRSLREAGGKRGVDLLVGAQKAV